MFSNYIAIDDSPETTVKKTAPQNFSLQQADALKRVVVYNQNYRESVEANDAEKVINQFKAQLDAEILKALQANLSVYDLKAPLQITSPHDAEVLKAAFAKAANAPETLAAAQQFYVEQIKTLSQYIRSNHNNLPKGETVSSLNEKILGYLKSYQTAGGDVSNEFLLGTLKLPLGTFCKFKQISTVPQQEVAPVTPGTPTPR